MESSSFNDDEGDAAEEKACGEKELPLPLPFPPSDTDEHDHDHCDSIHGKNARGKESLLGRIMNKQFQISNGHDRNVDDDAKSSVDETRRLDRLPPDVFVLMCCNLSVQDIASMATCSKALYVASLNRNVWRQKFLARWNFDDPTIGDWSFAYRQAYFNPHDLWITHWNCVDPCDGLGPGRCCIQEENQHPGVYNGKEKVSLKTANNGDDITRISSAEKDHQRHRCPSCRYHPCLESENDSECGGNANVKAHISTAAQAIHLATSLRLEESSHLLPCKAYTPHLAERAFTRASTFHRSIDPRQYKADSLCFLNDLLFFNVHDNHDENNSDDEPFEMKDWKEHAEKITENPNNTQDHERAQGQDPLRDCDAFEPALHSWHLANLCNPDYNRPIVWRVLIQRSDCFSVFPSEGYLMPGESKVVTFGVKPFGSMLAHATHQVNVHRDGVEKFWGNLYETEAHLPCAPFLFQYHYASNVPCHLADNNFQSFIQQQQQQQQQAIHDPEHPNPRPIHQLHHSQNHQLKSKISPWDQLSLDRHQYVRSIPLSGHVHASFSLTEFRRRTLVPYVLPSHQISETEKFVRRYFPREQQLTYSASPVVFCSPQLMEFYPDEWRRLQALRLEEQRNKSALASKYRTESACNVCGLTWGPRMEELGQAFVLAKLEIEILHQRLRKRLMSVYRILVCLVQYHQEYRRNYCLKKTNSRVLRNRQIIKRLRRKVMNYRGSPWLSRKESRVLLQWEVLLDILSRSTSTDQDNLETNKYNHLRHRGVYRYPTCTDSVFDKNACYDQDVSDLLIDSTMIVWKDEPNHLQSFSHLAYSPGNFSFPLEDHTNSNSIITDTFMNDQIFGLKSAISVLADPRSLLTHGLYDTAPYPGSIFRRSKLPILLKLHEKICLEKIRKHCRASFSPFITSQAQLAYYDLQESLDIQGLLIVNSIYSQCCDIQAPHPISLRNFIQNIPALGKGRFPCSSAECDSDVWFLEKSQGKVTEFVFEEKLHGLSYSSSSEGISGLQNLSEQNLQFDDAFGLQQVAGADNNILPRGHRILNVLWSFSSQLGWTVDENQSVHSVYVDRRILVATQCLSVTSMLLPLLVSLLGRNFQLIPATPTSYLLEGLPYELDDEMRFLTERECGYAGLLLVVLHCVLCRWIERYTNRDFFRTMMEYIPVRRECSLLQKFHLAIVEWSEQIWDAICPSTFQRLSFLAPRNRRNRNDLVKCISSWRSRVYGERESKIRAIAGRRGISAEERDNSINLGVSSNTNKILAGTGMMLGGFATSSPYFFLNLIAVFSCSMSLGISISLECLETGRAGFAFNSSGSIVDSLSLVTSMISGLLIGQLIGGSGGVLFLVEVVVTSMSLIMGGMGTISASGMKSWATFFCLSLVAFWGYLFGRCSVLENITKKKRGISSIMLCTSHYLVLSFLLLSLSAWHWETAVDLLIERPPINYRSGENFIMRKYDFKRLP